MPSGWNVTAAAACLRRAAAIPGCSHLRPLTSVAIVSAASAMRDQGPGATNRVAPVPATTVYVVIADGMAAGWHITLIALGSG